MIVTVIIADRAEWKSWHPQLHAAKVNLDKFLYFDLGHIFRALLLDQARAETFAKKQMGVWMEAVHDAEICDFVNHTIMCIGLRMLPGDWMQPLPCMVE